MSRSNSSCSAACPCVCLDAALLLREAPYPASSTAFIISAGLTLPCTPIEFVKRLTEQLSTPESFDTAFSTRALHAAQLIPVTTYCSILYPQHALHAYQSLIHCCYLGTVNKLLMTITCLNVHLRHQKILT